MKFIIGFLISLGLLIFVFVLIFRHTGPSTPKNTEASKLLNYANTSVEMQFTNVGQVSADQTHRAVEITVGSNETTVVVYQGYQGAVITSRSYANNPAAYADFLQALQLNGYNLGNPDKALADDRGRCASGNRYIMGIKDGERDVQRYWSTSCGGAATSRAKSEVIQNLFIKQVPDYNTIAGNAFSY